MLILQKMSISAELALPTFELLLPTFWGSNPRICWNFSRVPGSVERTCVTSVSQGSWRKYMPTHSDNNLCLSRRYRKIWGKFRLEYAMNSPPVSMVEHLGHEFRAVVNPDPVPNTRPLAIGPVIQ